MLLEHHLRADGIPHLLFVLFACSTGLPGPFPSSFLVHNFWTLLSPLSSGCCHSVGGSLGMCPALPAHSCPRGRLWGTGRWHPVMLNHSSEGSAPQKPKLWGSTAINQQWRKRTQCEALVLGGQT